MFAVKGEMVADENDGFVKVSDFHQLCSSWIVDHILFCRTHILKCECKFISRFSVPSPT
jgi:hypothetical protein